MLLLNRRRRAPTGALSLPDIGQIFPDTDPKWKGASSDQFVKEACKLMHERGYTIGNLDCTIIAQRPKLSPHKEDIRCRLLAHPAACCSTLVRNRMTGKSQPCSQRGGYSSADLFAPGD